MVDLRVSVRELLSAVRPGNAVRDAGLLGRIVDIGFQFDTWHIRVIRPRDLLVLDFGFHNLRREGGAVVRKAPGGAYLIVGHQPQSLADAAFQEMDGVPTEAAPQQAAVRVAEPSRLVFEMPAGRNALDYTLKGLLDACATWELHLDAGAQPEAPERPRPWSYKLSWLSHDLRVSMKAARDALSSGLRQSAITALNGAAERIAETAVGSARAGQVADARSMAAMVEREIGAALGARARVEEVDRAAAAVYLRAAAGRRAVLALSRDRGFVLDSVAKLVPDIFGYLLRPHPPSSKETAIELPYRLIGSPTKSAGFAHARETVEHGGRTELWHSRMGRRHALEDGAIEVDDRATEPVRYLWSPDYPDPKAGMPTLSLNAFDRRKIVQLTAGYDEIRRRERYIPRPVHAHRLMLTALGGWLDARRAWEERPDGVNLSAWVHRAAMARDQYVRVEYSGFLLPFRHAATLVKVTERKFEWRNGASAQDRIALLRQRHFIVVRDRVIAYPRAAPQPFDGRSLPFTEIECLVQITPDLAQPGSDPNDRLPLNFYTDPNPDIDVNEAFWPSRGAGTDYLFPLSGLDTAGRRITFNIPLFFVSETQNIAGRLDTIRDYYNGAPSVRRRGPTGGAIIRMASPGGTGAADVDIPIDWLDFKSANPTTGVPAGQTDELQQFPIVDQAQAKLAALERLTGIGQAPPVAFDPHFLAHEWADNPGEVFLRIKTPPPIAFGNDAPTDRVGGLATPDITPSALSRRFGLASGNADIFRTGTFNPAEYFPSAKLLGIFELKSLLQAVSLAAQPADAPTLTTTEIAGGTETRFRMVQRVAGQPLAPVLRTNEGGPTDLTLTAITRLLDGQPPQTIVQGEMTHFKVNLVGVLIIWFDRLRFYRENGRKPDVDVDLNPENGVTFGGPLEFINTLREFIPANGFSDPPNLSVTPAGITAGYSLGLPAVQLGVLALSNISLGAAFTIPFDGKSPTARFNFAERHNTFNLTVSLFGGGGFVALVVDTKEVKEIEAALEFGAAIAINLGVASGSVYVKGGFYFHFATDRVEFEGYVEIGGRLSVLGLISVSLTFHLSLNYEMLAKGVNGPQAISRLFGQATLVVEIEILFFSVSVSVTVEKTFIGSEADPTFLDFVPDQSVWDEYCTAFA